MARNHLRRANPTKNQKPKNRSIVRARTPRPCLNESEDEHVDFIVETVVVSHDDPWLQDAIMLLIALGKRTAASQESMIGCPTEGNPPPPEGPDQTPAPPSSETPKGIPWPMP